MPLIYIPPAFQKEFIRSLTAILERERKGVVASWETMATTGAAGDGLFRNVFEGCISGSDMGIQRRPYHRNCSCELHKSNGHCSHSSRRGAHLSYPIRRTWSEGSLALMASVSSSSASSSPASLYSNSPSAPATKNLIRAQTHLTLLYQEE